MRQYLRNLGVVISTVNYYIEITFMYTFPYKIVVSRWLIYLLI